MVVVVTRLLTIGYMHILFSCTTSRNLMQENLSQTTALTVTDCNARTSLTDYSTYRDWFAIDRRYSHCRYAVACVALE